MSVLSSFPKVSEIATRARRCAGKDLFSTVNDEEWLPLPGEMTWMSARMARKLRQSIAKARPDEVLNIVKGILLSQLSLK